MATIAESQQEMAEEYFKFWEDEYKPLESAQIKANLDLLPAQTELEKLRLAGETELQAGIYENKIQETKDAAPVMSEYYKQALEGVDPTRKAAEARTDVAAAFKDQEATLRRDAGRMGLDPNSNKFAESLGAGGLNQARATAGAVTAARTVAEDENFKRLTSAAQTYKAGLPV